MWSGENEGADERVGESGGGGAAWQKPQHHTCNDERSMLMSRSRLAISMREFCSAVCICACIQRAPRPRPVSSRPRNALHYNIVS
jgi:hypothetical protein